MLDDLPPADLPVWLLTALQPPPQPILRPVAVEPQPRHRDGGSAIGTAALDDRCAEIRNAPEGGKHQAVNEAAFAIGGMVSAGHLDEGTAWSALSDALLFLIPRCHDQRAAQALAGQVAGHELARARPELDGGRKRKSLDAHGVR